MQTGSIKLYTSIHQTSHLLLYIRLLLCRRFHFLSSPDKALLRSCHCQQSAQPTFSLKSDNSFNQSSVAPTPNKADVLLTVDQKFKGGGGVRRSLIDGDQVRPSWCKIQCGLTIAVTPPPTALSPPLMYYGRSEFLNYYQTSVPV